MIIFTFSNAHTFPFQAQYLQVTSIMTHFLPYIDAFYL